MGSDLKAIFIFVFGMVFGMAVVCITPTINPSGLGAKAPITAPLRHDVPIAKPIETVTVPKPKYKIVRARVTAYDPARCCCGKFANGKTSTGKNAWRIDGCSIDPRAIPYGTKIDIPGIGIRVADDTGPAMRKSWDKGIYHIDIRFKYHYQARRWGNKWLNVKIYDKES